MGVYKRKRSKSKIDFYYEMDKVIDEIQTVVDNQSYYSKRQTFRRAVPLLDTSKELQKEICIANSNIPTCREDYKVRREHQIIALGLAEALLKQFQRDCQHMRTIPSSKKRHVTGLCVDLQDMLKAWMNSDKNRYKNLK